MLCPVYGHELTPLSCPPSQGVSFRSFKGLIILSPYRVFTNDLVFELISGILHAPSKGYQAAFDISSSQYALTPENARSVRGRISVSADRNYDDYGRPGAAKAEDGSPEKAGIAAANDNPG